MEHSMTHFVHFTREIQFHKYLLRIERNNSSSLLTMRGTNARTHANDFQNYFKIIFKLTVINQLYQPIFCVAIRTTTKLAATDEEQMVNSCTNVEE